MRVFKVSEVLFKNVFGAEYNLTQGIIPYTLLGTADEIVVKYIDYSYRIYNNREVKLEGLTKPLSNYTSYFELEQSMFTIRLPERIDDFTRGKLTMSVSDGVHGFVEFKLDVLDVEDNLLVVYCNAVSGSPLVPFSFYIIQCMLFQDHDDQIIATYTEKDKKDIFSCSAFDGDIMQCNVFKGEIIDEYFDTQQEHVVWNADVSMFIGYFKVKKISLYNLMFLKQGYNVEGNYLQNHVLNPELSLLIGTTPRSFTAFDVRTVHANHYNDGELITGVSADILEHSIDKVERQINVSGFNTLFTTHWLYFSRDKSTHTIFCNNTDYVQKRTTSILDLYKKLSPRDNRVLLVAVIQYFPIPRFGVVLRELEFTNYSEDYKLKYLITIDPINYYNNLWWSRWKVNNTISHIVTINDDLNNIRQINWFIEYYDIERSIWILGEQYSLDITATIVNSVKPYYITKPENHIDFFIDGVPSPSSDVMAAIIENFPATIIIRNIAFVATTKYRVNVTITTKNGDVFTKFHEIVQNIEDITETGQITENQEEYITSVIMGNEPFNLSIFVDNVGNYCIYETNDFNTYIYLDDNNYLRIHKTLLDMLEINTFSVLIRRQNVSPSVIFIQRRPHIKLDNIYHFRGLACECPAFMPVLQNEVITYIAPVTLYSRQQPLYAFPAGHWYMYNILPNTCIDNLYESTFLVASIPGDYIDIWLHFANRIDGSYVQGTHFFRVRGILKRLDDEATEERYVTQQRNELSIFRGYRKQYEVELYVTNPLQLNSIELMKYSHMVSIRTRRGLVRDYKQLVVSDYKILDNLERLVVIVSLRETKIRTDYRYKL